VQHIQESAVRLIYTDDPLQYQKWAVKEGFNPFSGYSADMISLALTDPAIPQRYKVRYLMQGVLFEEIEAEYPGFYVLKTSKQAEIVDTFVAKYIDESGANSAPDMVIPAVDPQKAAA
jgi:hypothetical protein